MGYVKSNNKYKWKDWLRLNRIKVISTFFSGFCSCDLGKLGQSAAIYYRTLHCISLYPSFLGESELHTAHIVVGSNGSSKPIGSLEGRSGKGKGVLSLK